MRVLHFYFGSDFNCRLQRAIQSDLDNGFDVVAFVNREIENNLWIPDREKVELKFFEYNRLWHYRVPSWCDYLNLKNFDFDLVHAHDPFCADYALRLGFPVVFDDWEYWLEYMDFVPLRTEGVKGVPSVLLRRLRAWKLVKNLLWHVPVIVTNRNVKDHYLDLDAVSVDVVPNVPLRFERDYAFAGTCTEKPDKMFFCYIGDFDADNWSIRDTSELRNVWSRKWLGPLHVFGGKTKLSHLDLIRRMRMYDFNLLVWKKFWAHPYFLQNKAFLASAVGVPTIISSSLLATIDLLQEYAFPVDNARDIYAVVENFSYRPFRLHPEHLWEYYESAIKNAYNQCLN